MASIINHHSIGDDDKATLSEVADIKIIKKQRRNPTARSKRRYNAHNKQATRLNFRKTEARTPGLRRIDPMEQWEYGDIPSKGLPSDDSLVLPDSDKWQTIAKWYVINTGDKDGIRIERYTEFPKAEKRVEKGPELKTGPLWILLQNTPIDRVTGRMVSLVRQEIIELNGLHRAIVPANNTILANGYMEAHDVLR